MNDRQIIERIMDRQLNEHVCPRDDLYEPDEDVDAEKDTELEDAEPEETSDPVRKVERAA